MAAIDTDTKEMIQNNLALLADARSGGLEASETDSEKIALLVALHAKKLEMLDDLVHDLIEDDDEEVVTSLFEALLSDLGEMMELL